jgi:hypothetical protein
LYAVAGTTSIGLKPTQPQRKPLKERRGWS